MSEPSTTVTIEEVVERRFAAQHLTGPLVGSVAEVVSDSLAVQAQDPPLSRWSVGFRADVNDAGVRAAIDAGEIIRTHVLRPTWHYVHRSDLRWLLELTSPKVISSMGARHRMLGVDDSSYAVAEKVFTKLLADGPVTRKQLHEHLPTTSYPRQGEVVGHLLMLAELRGLICSGPLLGEEHSYVLVDDVVGPEPPLEPEVANDRLIRRFVEGHGPTAIKDLQRWCGMTLTAARKVFASRDFAHAQVDGVDLWWLPGCEPAGTGGVHLLPTFDEAFLSHTTPRFDRLPGHRMADAHFNPGEAGRGFVLIDGIDSGMFRRVVTGRDAKRKVAIEFDLVEGVATEHGPRLDEAAAQLVSFFT